ncbi:hypothetical protein AT746_08560 [Lacimicrobium alkaliphilum]|uniref:Uncharacterized protein n=1 Tax=Lacimicrobium alkaliphilum TaxID=1526571 RepID=A0A0U3AZA3_9ALTE|nr:hypothetical protein AT746_08560 [Lacimicrobium alkaliphilum]
MLLSWQKPSLNGFLRHGFAPTDSKSGVKKAPVNTLLQTEISEACRVTFASGCLLHKKMPVRLSDWHFYNRYGR